MRKLTFTVAVSIGSVLLMATALLPRVSNAQNMANSMTAMDARQAQQTLLEQDMRQKSGDPREEAAYQAFHKANADDGDKKVHLGISFLTKYQSDRYTEAVYEELSQTYYDRKDLADFYSYSEKGLALFPDDVYLLALSGWATPRAFDSYDADADKKLDRSELYEKHALDVLGTMKKPENFSDEVFSQYKTGESAVAHSGLGMVYFRREEYEESAKELEIATKTQATPDATDYFVLGADLHNLGRYKDAADAFNRCAQLPSTVQDNCKKYAADATQRAANSQ